MRLLAPTWLCARAHALVGSRRRTGRSCRKGIHNHNDKHNNDHNDTTTTTTTTTNDNNSNNHTIDIYSTGTRVGRLASDHRRMRRSAARSAVLIGMFRRPLFRGPLIIILYVLI